MSHWRGQDRDPFFQDFLAAIRAKVAPPRPKGPAARTRRRLAWGGSSVTSLVVLAVFIFDASNLQSRLCTLKVAQPGLSDACGAMGWGARPTQAERVAWMEASPRSCADLRDFGGRFPNGHFSDTALAWLAAARLEPDSKREKETLELPGYVRMAERGQATQEAAKQIAVERATTEARESLCRPFEPSHRLLGVEVAPRVGGLRCESRAGGRARSLHLVAKCHPERAQLVERCGPRSSEVRRPIARAGRQAPHPSLASFRGFH